jgi:hypothetical protein
MKNTVSDCKSMFRYLKIYQFPKYEPASSKLIMAPSFLLAVAIGFYVKIIFLK